MPVRLIVEDGPYAGVSRVDLGRRARAMLEILQLKDRELSILLTGDNQIQKLNRIYRKKNRPTDVLAFAQHEGELGDRSDRLLGDVVVSIPTARRQADARKRDLVSEVTMLLAHGLLHLLGWDHQTDAEDRRMRLETNRLCAAAEAAALAPRVGRRAGGHALKGAGGHALKGANKGLAPKSSEDAALKRGEGGAALKGGNGRIGSRGNGDSLARRVTRKGR
jgi:probable rRNA maturation factor